MSKAMRWTAEADQKLLLLIISSIKISYDDVAARWAAEYRKLHSKTLVMIAALTRQTANDAVTPTARALSEHVGKLKKGAAASSNSTPTPKTAKFAKSVPSTPASAKHHNIKTPKTSGKRKWATPVTSDDDDDEDKKPIGFTSDSKRSIPGRRSTTQRKKYTEESSEDETAIAQLEAIPESFTADSERKHNIYDSAVEQPAVPSEDEEVGKKSIARSKTNPRFDTIVDADHSDDDFIPGL